MKATIFYGKDGLRVENHPQPKAADNELLLKVRASGVCGGEYNIYKKRETISVLPEGIILGHEIIGEVVESRGHFAAGQLVAVSPNSGCGSCWFCTHGLTYECRNKPQRTACTGGGYADYVVANPAQCIPLPDGADVQALAMAEPLACCIHSVRRIDIRMGDRVAILGAGAGAQLFVQLANRNGAAQVVVFDNMPERLALASELGADTVVNTDKEDVLAVAAAQDGFDVVLVTRSSPAFFEQALTMCSWHGRVLCYGVASGEKQFQVIPNLVWKKQLSLIGSRSFEGDAFEVAVRLLVGKRIKVDKLIDRVISLEQIEHALTHVEGQIKTVIVP